LLLYFASCHLAAMHPATWRRKHYRLAILPFSGII
jgi:hypothetical protein